MVISIPMILRNTLSAFRGLWVNKLRSALTMLGIVIGVGAVIAMVAIGAGAQEKVAEQIRTLGTNVIQVHASSINTGGVRGGTGTLIRLTEDDAAAIQRQIPAVQAAAPFRARSMQVVHESANWATVVAGVTAEWFDVKEWGLTEGRAITLEDYRTGAKVMVLGQSVAHTLFGEDSPLDLTVRVGRVPFTVIGVLQRKGQSATGQDLDDLVVVPLSTGQQKLFGRYPGRARAIWVIAVKVWEGEDLAPVETAIRELLRQRHGLQPEQDDDFTLRRLSEVLRTQEETSRVMAYLLAAIAGVSLLVGGIGIMNMMLVSVTERTREIGLRMAVGARRRDILAQFLMEAVSISLLGGVIGVGVGLVGSEALSYAAEWRTLIAAEAIALAFGVAAVTGVVFGFYPAYRAAGLDPIEALRWE
jgi:putative ABC transport system permease protein